MYHHKKERQCTARSWHTDACELRQTYCWKIGGGCAEALVISRCRRLFRNQEFKCELIDVSMNTDDAENEGMVFGGSISVLLEQIK